MDQVHNGYNYACLKTPCNIGQAHPQEMYLKKEMLHLNETLEGQQVTPNTQKGNLQCPQVEIGENNGSRTKKHNAFSQDNEAC